MRRPFAVEFRLDPLESLRPWASRGGREPELGWFLLSRGRFRFTLGDHRLFEYAEAGAAPMHSEHDEPRTRRWVSYDLVRPWEDLLELLPNVLRPVGAELATLMRLDESTWERFVAEAFDLAESGGLDPHSVETLSDWQGARVFDNGYLAPSAKFWLWSEGDVVEARWDNTRAAIDGVPVWTATRGSVRMSTAEFVDGVAAFDKAFLAAMDERVVRIRREGGLPGFHIDLDALAREHEERAGRAARSRSIRPEVAIGEVERAARTVLTRLPLDRFVD